MPLITTLLLVGLVTVLWVGVVAGVWAVLSVPEVSHPTND